MTISQATAAPSRWARPFFTIWIGQAFSLLGSQLVQFALIWWLTQTTGSARVLAAATMAGLLPQVLLGPIIGAMVDRWNRRLIMIVADSTIALATLALAYLFASGQQQIWQIYLLMLIRSIAGGFHWPAMQASTSLMVPREHLARIQGLNQMLQGGMNIVSAPLGALLLIWSPIQGILMIDVGTALMAIVPLFFIKVPQPEAQGMTAEGKPTSGVWQDLLVGLRYVFSWPGLVIIGVMATVINFLVTPAFTMLPLLVTKHFGGQAIQLAGLESVMGIGVIMGGLTLSVWGGFRKRILTSLLGVEGLALGSLLVGAAPASAYFLAVGAMFIVGFFLPITNGPIMAAIQGVVAPEMQGRVLTLLNSFAGAMTPLSLIIAAPLADTFGVQSWFLLAGVVTALMGICGLFIPAVMKFEEGRKQPEPSAQDAVHLETTPIDGD
jgi:DHA3 family macrolide efflux protein-like MFS transporter